MKEITYMTMIDVQIPNLNLPKMRPIGRYRRTMQLRESLIVSIITRLVNKAHVMSRSFG